MPIRQKNATDQIDTSTTAPAVREREIAHQQSKKEVEEVKQQECFRLKSEKLEAQSKSNSLLPTIEEKNVTSSRENNKVKDEDHKEEDQTKRQCLRIHNAHKEVFTVKMVNSIQEAIRTHEDEIFYKDVEKKLLEMNSKLEQQRCAAVLNYIWSFDKSRKVYVKKPRSESKRKGIKCPKHNCQKILSYKGEVPSGYSFRCDGSSCNLSK